MADINLLIAKLNLISRDISKRKINLILNGGEDSDIMGLDQEQRNRVAATFAKFGITNQEQAVDLFYKNNKVYFYGDDPTDFGMINQMLLYDIRKLEKDTIKILNRSKNFDWIILDHRYFHGIYDFAKIKKTGAQTVGQDKIIFYNDTDDFLNQTRVLKSRYNNNDISNLIGEQWKNEIMTEKNLVNDYINWLKIHEVSHLILDDILNIESLRISPDDYYVYDIESERFSILGQMAVSNLHAYTLFNFMSLFGENPNYNESVSLIIKDFNNVIESNKSLFSNIKSLNSDAYLLYKLTNTQIGSVAGFLFNEYYQNVLSSKDDVQWYVDHKNMRIIFMDMNDYIISRNIDYSLYSRKTENSSQ